jgi:hypothetical protein
MAVVEPETIVKLADILARKSLTIQKSSDLSDLAAEYNEALYDARNRAVSQINHEHCDDLMRRAKVDQMCRNYLFRFVQGLVHTVVRSSGVPRCNGIEAFCDYHNRGRGGPYRALMSPVFDELFGFCYPGSFLGAHNVFSPGVDFMGFQAVDGKFEAGRYVNVNRYAGVTELYGYITDIAFDGKASGNIVAIGEARDKSGNIVDGRQWSLRFDALSGNATGGAFVPAEDGDLCVRVHELRFPGNMEAGSVTLSGNGPTTQDNKGALVPRVGA